MRSVVNVKLVVDYMVKSLVRLGRRIKWMVSEKTVEVQTLLTGLQFFNIYDTHTATYRCWGGTICHSDDSMHLSTGYAYQAYSTWNEIDQSHLGKLRCRSGMSSQNLSQY